MVYKSFTGMFYSCRVHEKPEGIAQVLIVGAEFVGQEPCCRILGDNLFQGHGLPDLLERVPANLLKVLTEGAFFLVARSKTQKVAHVLNLKIKEGFKNARKTASDKIKAP